MTHWFYPIDWTDTGLSTAAWFQAVGSVGAIAGAAWLASRQTREALSREERDRAAARSARRDLDQTNLLIASRLVSAFRVKAEVFMMRLDEDVDNLNRSHVGVPTRLTFRSALRRMADLPLTTIRPSGVVLLYTDAIECADLITGLLEAMNESCEEHPGLAARVIAPRIPDLRAFVKQLIETDDLLRDQAEPGWRTRLAPVE